MPASAAATVPTVSTATSPPAASQIDPHRRGVVGSRLIDHRRGIPVAERIDADADIHPGIGGWGCRKHNSTEEK
jgi:hypothetical protein